MGYKRKVKENKRFILSREKRDDSYVYFLKDKEDKDRPEEEVYTIIGDQISYKFGNDNIPNILFDGFKEVPSSVASDLGFGFSNKAIQNFLRFKFDKKKTITITNKTETKESGNALIINIDDLEELGTSLNQEQRACNDTKRMLIKNFLVKSFPSLNYAVKETNNNKDLILRNLNKKLIEQLNADEIERFGEFYVEAAQKYKRDDLVRRMLLDLQRSAQLLTLQEVVKKYEALLASNPLEAKWQEFFDEHITLFDNRYIKKLNYKNIATGITKYPDLVLVDIYGYIDFYELKRSSTQLLKYDQSHKTYYWSKDMAMVISQASDYLQKAKENAASFANAIKTETSVEEGNGLEINIVNPRAIIVAGQSSDLTNDKMRHQFKTLREGLKDIEFLLYDELLLRLQNLLANVRVK